MNRMVSTLSAFFSLYNAVFLLLAGIGLLSTFLSLRMTLEGYSATVVGMVMSGYFVGLIAGSFVWNRFIERIGHIRAFAVFAAMCAVCVMVHGLWISPVVWGVLRIITGAVVIGLYMVIESWLNASARPDERGRVFSVYMLITYMGLGVGQFLLMIADVNRPDYFMVLGILFSLSLIPVATTRSAHPALPERASFNLPGIIRKAPLGMAGCLVAGLLNSAIFSLGPVFAYRIGLSVNSISLFMGFVILGGMVFQYPVGMLSDRLDRARVLGALGLAVGISSLLIVFFPEDSIFLLIFSVFYGGLAFTIYPVAVAHANDRFKPAEIVGGSAALLLSFGVGGSIGPSLSALFMGPLLGPKGLFAFIALTGGIYGAVAIWFGSEKAERRAVDQPVPFVIRSTAFPGSGESNIRTVDSDFEGEDEETASGTAGNRTAA